MYAQVEKPKENKSKAAANSVAQKKSNMKQCFGFVDNRPEIVIQKKLKELIVDNLKISQPAQLQPIQMKALLESDMEFFARSLSNGNSRSTVAVAKKGSNYMIYSQSSLSSMSSTINDYNNVTLKSDRIMGKGYHAEVIALMDTGGGIDSIAASQVICMRCQAALADNSVTAKNPGTQYTEHWQAPFNEEIDENKSFPAKAEDRSRDGQSGTRWVMNSGRLYLIAKSVWGNKHTSGW